ncbi:molybdopterin-guanine dinucleotide biosynthesis protein B [Nereida sp.]|uniref:molybdopterin-guanine dinucleotide biosynthesis protein B n=1 Tax=Nereida sp. TaxID=2736090 RepID=UPI003F69BE97
MTEQKVFGVIGWKNAGKTGLMERLVAEISARGFSVSTLKHAHHNFDIDQQGKDSYRHRDAGAQQVLLASANRWALMTELRGEPEPPLEKLLAQLAPVDLVLVEGFKRNMHPKVCAYRQQTSQSMIEDASVLAYATDTVLDTSKPQFDLDDTVVIADFICAKAGL